MKKEIYIYISELLFIHDCVIIPDFGGFIGNKKSAFLNKKNNTISPPSKEILFNKNLNINDGLLISYIANKEEISNEESTKIVDIFVKKIRSQLKEQKTFRIKKVGLLSMGSDENILFLPDSSMNYNIESFGMADQKIYKVNSVENEIKTIVSEVSKSKNRRKLWKAAAIMVPVIGISLISLTQQEKINNLYSDMANLNPLSIFESEKKISISEEKLRKAQEKINNLNSVTKINKKKKEKINNLNRNSKSKLKTESKVKENKSNTHNNIESIKESQVKETKPNKAESVKNKFFIIAGSFSNKDNAETLVKDLKSKNYNSSIIGMNDNGLIRVCYDACSTREKAVLILKNVKSRNQDGWILSL